MIQQQAEDGNMTLLRGLVQRTSFLVVSYLDIDATVFSMVQKDSHDVCAPQRRGYSQSSVSAVIEGVDSSAARQEKLYGCCVSATNGIVQRSLQCAVDENYQVCGMVEESLLNGSVALRHRKVQRRLSIVHLDHRIGAPLHECFCHG